MTYSASRRSGQPEALLQDVDLPNANEVIAAPGLRFSGQERRDAVRSLARSIVKSMGHNPDDMVTVGTQAVMTPRGLRHIVQKSAQQPLWVTWTLAADKLLSDILI